MNTAVIRPWEGYAKPFRVAGDVYFVGTIPASTHIIDTGDGLILIDSGYPQSLYLVIANMAELGFSYKDIKYIVHSHGHYDHLGATKALKELTGAKTCIGAPDADFANGKLDLTWAREIGTEYYEQFEPDILLNDGDIIKLGNTSIRCISTPGHTPGTMSFFFETKENGKTFTCAMFGGMGTNSMMLDWLEKNGLSDSCRLDFIHSLKKVRNIPVDIHIGNHFWISGYSEKLKKLGQSENPFIDATEWKRVIDASLSEITTLIAEGR